MDWPESQGQIRFVLGSEAKMERRYYLLKIAIVMVAVVTAAITGGMSSTHVAHAVNHARYSAPAEVQAAAWHTTAYVAHAVASLLGSNSCATL